MKYSRFLSREGLKRILPLCAIIFLWGIFILPSAFDPHWFYLDDPTTLLVGQSLAADFHLPRPDGVTGRYFPAYWLYYALLFNFFSFNLTGYYAVQALIFLLTLLLVYAIVIRTTRSEYAGLLAAFLVATASPVAENIYTFGKAEPKVLFYLICALYLFILSEHVNNAGKKIGIGDAVKSRKSSPNVMPAQAGIQTSSWRKPGTRKHWTPAFAGVTTFYKFIRIVSWIGMTVLMTVAILTKETAMVFFVFAASGGAIGWLLNKKGYGINKYDIKPYLFLLTGSVCSILFGRGLFYLLRPPLSAENYTSYAMSREIFLDNLKFYAGQQPDVLVMGLLAAVVMVISYIKMRGENSKNFIFAGSLFLTGSAYMLGLLIWRRPVAYYLLVPAAFFSLAIVIMGWSFYRPSISNRKGYLIIALMLMTCLYSIPYFAFIAHALKAPGKVYTEAIGHYMQVAKPGERLLVEEWPFFVEPVIQSNILLKNILGKGELSVDGILDIINDMAVPADALKHNMVSKIPDRKSRYPKENDYILTLTGDRQSPWVLSSISPFLNEKGSVYKQRGLEMEDIATGNVKWRGIELTVPFIRPKLRTYSAGYHLYKVKNPQPAVAWEGRWADGWIGGKAQCSLKVSKQKTDFIFNGFVTEYTIPSSLRISSGNRIIKKVLLDKAGPFSFTLELLPAGMTGFVHFEFTTEKTFNPKERGLSNDNRNLGVQIKVMGIEG